MTGVSEGQAAALTDRLAAPLVRNPGAGRRCVIAELVRDVSAVELSWLDEQVRHGSYAQYWSNAWHNLAPAAISRLAHTYDLNAAVIGLLAPHANGFVRAAALEVLAQYNSSQEISFLSLRVNDWVEPIAVRIATRPARPNASAGEGQPVWREIVGVARQV